MKRIVIISLTTALTIAFAALARVPEEKREPSARVRRFLGKEATEIIASATRVEAFRLKNQRAKEDRPSIGGYAVAAAARDAQGQEFAGELAAVLLDEKTYLFDAAKACIFNADIGFRMWSGERSIEIVLCFSCDELIVFSPRADDGSVRSAGEDFDPARAKLVRLVKAALPDDPRARELPERK